ncbi:MAG: PhzF family phenazine biosynthesis isomerase [Candidatus Cloacimonadaceae bacterium]
MSYPVYMVNAFTEHFYKGNQAAVVAVEEFPSDTSMLTLAKEFGFSETAFVKRLGFGKYAIRWFTPEAEVNLCGHATLAAAKVLFHEIIPHEKLILFQSLSGDLLARKKGEDIQLDFPIDEPSKIETDNRIVKALSQWNAEEILYSPQTKNLIVVYNEADTVLALKPNFTELAKFKSDTVFGIIVTAAFTGNYDYICRYFAPWEGINEDPVTGSAQTCLAPYWSKKLNKTELAGFQASSRGGEFKVELDGNRVLISGRAFIYLKGEIKRGF